MQPLLFDSLDGPFDKLSFTCTMGDICSMQRGSKWNKNHGTHDWSVFYFISVQYVELGFGGTGKICYSLRYHFCLLSSACSRPICCDW